MGTHTTGKSTLMRRIEMELRGLDIPVQRTGHIGRRAALVPLPESKVSIVLPSRVTTIVA
ncbi:hypothetical protein ACIQKE_33435 [Streptomyces griseoviridis]